MNFKQKFEPKDDKVIHGAGQSIERFKDYWNAVGKNKPLIYMMYIRINEIKEKLPKKFKDMENFNRNLIPQIGLNFKIRSKGSQVKEIAEGQYDQHIGDLCDVFSKFKKPIFLRIGYEFDKEGKYDPEYFRKAWKYLVGIIRKKGITNVATVWCACPYNGTSPVEPYYPGDNYVDWFGIDVFGVRHFEKLYPPVEGFLELAKKHKKPVMIGESSAISSRRENKDDWKEWFVPYFDWIKKHPVIKAFCYINWDWGVDWKQPEWGNARIDNKTELLQEYKKELSKKSYLQNIPLNKFLEEVNL